jgi:hypothetical protein
VAVVGLALIAGLVLNGQSTNRRAADAIASSNATASTPSTAEPTTTLDPKVALTQEYVAIAADGDQASAAYDSACGCPNHFNRQHALAALPAFVAAYQDQAKRLETLSVEAPPVVASHLLTLSHYESDVVHTAQEILLYAGGMDSEALTRAFQLFDAGRQQAAQMAAMVRTDLGLG